MTERLPASAQTLQDLKSTNPADTNAMDVEEPSAMEMDNVESRPEKRFSTSRRQLSDVFLPNFQFMIVSISFNLNYKFTMFSLFCSHLNGRTEHAYTVCENEQWCLTTLGYVKAFSRQYASEVFFFPTVPYFRTANHEN